MNELAIKLAEMLGVGIESAVELYPVLRDQFVIYELISNLNFFISLAVVILFLVFIVIGISGAEMYFDGDDEDVYIQRYRHIVKKLMWIIVILVFTLIALSAIRTLLAPDIIVIKEFIN